MSSTLPLTIVAFLFSSREIWILAVKSFGNEQPGQNGGLCERPPHYFCILRGDSWTLIMRMSKDVVKYFEKR